MLDLPNPALIGVVHLRPLPGSPRSIQSIDEVLRLAIADAEMLKSAGFDAAIIENFGDMPFAPRRIAPETTAAMAVIARAVRTQVGLLLGINALRNDAISALGIAVAADAGFIRVNVHTGVYATDQGLIEGDARRTLLHRKRLGARIAILADVNVKHAVALGESDVVRAAKQTAYRGLADGLIVTGRATGESVDMDELIRVKEAVPDRRVFVGSGATAATVARLLQISNGVIVGTSIKKDGQTEGPVDLRLAHAFVRAAGRG